MRLLLYCYQPREIILPATNSDGSLAQFLRKAFNFKVTTCQRKYFNENRGKHSLIAGLLYVRQLGVAEVDSNYSLYLALGCFAALLKYVEISQAITFAANSVEVTVRSSLGTMMLDIDTVRSLELIENIRTGRKEGSLFSILDHTRTSFGAKRLITELVQPPNGTFPKLHTQTFPRSRVDKLA